jgi:hypothetical protein
MSRVALPIGAAQSSPLLNISFFCHCRTQRHSKARKSTQASCPRFGRTPTNTRIQTSEAVRILDRQRSLSHTAHSLHCGTTDRRLRHSSRLIVHEDRIEAVKFVGAACEARDTRRLPCVMSLRFGP